ncbi:unnamed protein product [Mytilus edulis]|uniref:DZIP3-like HEPN domain-containing protein n=1 Tax=Mytilus edulis TaxID=6550 RepID=A0A8S3TGK7_MYTED|nr:unnamed protein product [Mytilus edulis]
MVDAGADVNSPGSHYALQMLVLNERNTEVIEFLMRNGIAMNFTDYNRKSPLFYAITYTNLTIHAFLVENDSKQNPLHAAVYNSNIFKTKHLLSSRNIKWVSNNGWSVFHFAAYNNDIAMMDIIFETAMTRYREGNTLLHAAANIKSDDESIESVQMLLERGANPLFYNSNGYMPTDVASKRRVVPDALRKYFDGRIPPASLATTINQNSTTIVNLVNRRVINISQLGILQRIPGTIWPPRCPAVPTGSNATSSADFDVTLMVCLLRNIPLPGIYQPASGWDNLPIPSDTSPGAYLSRIKYYLK